MVDSGNTCSRGGVPGARRAPIVVNANDTIPNIIEMSGGNPPLGSGGRHFNCGGHGCAPPTIIGRSNVGGTPTIVQRSCGARCGGLGAGGLADGHPFVSERSGNEGTPIVLNASGPTAPGCGQGCGSPIIIERSNHWGMPIIAHGKCAAQHSGLGGCRAPVMPNESGQCNRNGCGSLTAVESRNISSPLIIHRNRGAQHGGSTQNGQHVRVPPSEIATNRNEAAPNNT